MPQRILAHGWWLMGREKMSKSLGNVVNPLDYIEKFGADALRYFICRELPLGNDTDFTEERFLQRFNADLANDLGNLVNRSLSMLQRYRGGVVPARGELSSVDMDLRHALAEAWTEFEKTMEIIDYGKALDALWKLVARANRYVDETAPWKLAKDPAMEKRLDTVLNLLVNTARCLCYLISPVMPETAAKIEAQMQLSDAQRRERLSWESSLPQGHAIGKASPLFPRQAKSE